MTGRFRKRGAELTVFAVLVFLGVGCNTFQTQYSPPEHETGHHLEKLNEVVELIHGNHVRDVDFDGLVRSAIEGMLENLDPYSTYLTREMYEEMQASAKGVFGGLGLVVSVKDGVLTVVSPIENTPAFNAGILAGDAIVRIDGEDIRDFSINEAVSRLRGPKGSYATLSVMRRGFEKPRAFTIRREIIKVDSVRHHVLHDGIGYVRISSFQEDTSAELKKFLKILKSRINPLEGLVIDLRNNPGGLLDQAIDSADLFVENGVIITAKGRDFEKIYRAGRRRTEPEVPMIVLINGGSASGSEILAAALRDNKRALLLGTRSFGKGLMQVILPLKDGSALKLTAAEYFTPGGVSIDGIGLTPDYTVFYSGSREDETPDTGEEAQPNFFCCSEADLVADSQVRRAIQLIRNWDAVETMHGENN